SIRGVGVNANCIRSDGHVVSIHGASLALGQRPCAPHRRVGRILGLMFTRDDEAALGIVIEIGIILRDEGVAATLIDLLMQRSLHTEQRHLVYVGCVGYGFRDVHDPRCHAVERAMWLYVIESHPFSVKEGLESTDLIQETVRELFTADLHFSPPEALQI